MDNDNLNCTINGTLSFSQVSEKNTTTAENYSYSNARSKREYIKYIQLESGITMPHFLPTTMPTNQIKCHDSSEILNTIKPEVNTESDLKKYPCDNVRDYESNTTNSTITSEILHTVKFVPLGSISNNENKDEAIESDSRYASNTENANSISKAAIDYENLGNNNFLLKSMIEYFTSESIVATETLSRVTSNNKLHLLSGGRECELRVKELVRDYPELQDIKHDEENDFKIFHTFEKDTECDKDSKVKTTELVNENNHNMKDELVKINQDLLYNTLDNIEKHNDLRSFCTFINDKRECEETLSESDYCSGYQSSDFEFIDESEAKADIMLDTKEVSNTETVKDTKDSDFIDTYNVNEISKGFNSYIRNYSFDYLGGASSSSNILTYKNTFRNNNALQRNINYQKYHIIPEGDNFLNLFQGAHIPTFELRFMENKSTFARNLPSSAVNGEGFDINILLDGHKQYETENDVQEAKKSEKEILSLYPQHNRKYGRRF